MRRVVLALVLLLGIHLRAGAQPADPCAVPDPLKGVLRYTIDLSNGATDAKTRYKTDDQIQILFKNKNPFLYEYRIKIEEQAVPEPALGLFFKVFNTSATAALLAAVPSEAVPPAAAPPPPPALAKKSDCDLALDAFRSARPDFKRLQATYRGLKSQAEQISKLFSDLQAGIDPEEKNLQNPSNPCVVLAPAAVTIRDLIQQALNESIPGSLGQRLKQFGAELAAFGDSLKRQRRKLARARESLTEAECSAKRINEELEPLERKLREFLDAEKSLRETSARFDTAANEARVEAKLISDILQNPQSFWETRQVGDYDEITLVTITVDRRDKKAATTAFSNFLVEKLRFGGRQRFALGAGAAFTPLDKTTYQAIQGLKMDGTSARVVGLEDDAGERVTPLIMLHTRIFERSRWIPWSSGWHLSLGFAGATGDNGVNLEYLTGLSASFAEERFFLTLGAYNGRTEKLQDGYSLGSELPNTVTSVPVARDRDWDIGFALTVKFR
jgi:hypothetical protein